MISVICLFIAFVQFFFTDHILLRLKSGACHFTAKWLQPNPVTFDLSFFLCRMRTIIRVMGAVRNTLIKQNDARKVPSTGFTLSQRYLQSCPQIGRLLGALHSCVLFPRGVSGGRLTPQLSPPLRSFPTALQECQELLFSFKFPLSPSPQRCVSKPEEKSWRNCSLPILPWQPAVSREVYPLSSYQPKICCLQSLPPPPPPRWDRFSHLAESSLVSTRNEYL